MSLEEFESRAGMDVGDDDSFVRAPVLAMDTTRFDGGHLAAAAEGSVDLRGERLDEL